MGGILWVVGYAPISRVATPPSPPSSGDSLSVIDETGAIFPGIPFVALVWREDEVPEVGVNAEYVQVIGRTGDLMSLVRGGAALAIEANWMFAVVETIPNYEPGDTVTVTGHFAAHVPPYRLHLREPTGGTITLAALEGVTHDGAGNTEYVTIPDKQGLWAFRWEGADGHLEDNAFFVNYSTAL